MQSAILCSLTFLAISLATLLEQARPTAGVTSADSIGQVLRLSDRNLTYAIPRGTLPGTLDAGKLRLETSIVTMPTTGDMQSLLVAQGIQWNPTVLGAIYDLNPSIDNLNLVKPGTPVVLPRANGDSEFQTAMGLGYRLVLMRDVVLSNTITASSSRLQLQAERLATVGVGRFAQASDQPQLRDAVASARGLIASTLDGELPVPQRVLQQTYLNARAIDQELNQALSQDKIMPEVARAVADIVTSQKAIVTDLQNGGSGLGRVIAYTISATDGTPRMLLRVQFAPMLDLDSVDQFDNPTSPAIQALVIGADYSFWAPNCDKKVTTRVQKGANPITLLIKSQ